METLWLRASEWREWARDFKADGWWVSDLAGVDALGLSRNEQRFEVVVQFVHMEKKERALVHVAAIGDPPTIPSVTDLWPTADFHEREAYDMFGIIFDGHPNLTRILMPDEWEGHPLRKDYGVGKVQIEFKPEPLVQIERPSKWGRAGAKSTGPESPQDAREGTAT
jgi:NADH:ubiquinone oxidoreductase subunit C